MCAIDRRRKRKTAQRRKARRGYKTSIGAVDEKDDEIPQSFENDVDGGALPAVSQVNSTQ